MSYARFSRTSSVYVFLDGGTGQLECCACSLVGGGGHFHARNTAAMVMHLDEHRAAGHRIADDTIERLRAEARENDCQAVLGIFACGHHAGHDEPHAYYDGLTPTPAVRWTDDVYGAVSVSPSCSWCGGDHATDSPRHRPQPGDSSPGVHWEASP